MTENQYKIVKLTNPNHILTNCVYMNNHITDYIQINGEQTGIFKVMKDQSLDKNTIYLNDFQQVYIKTPFDSFVTIKNIFKATQIKEIDKIKFTAFNSACEEFKLDVNKVSELIRNILLNIPINHKQEFPIDIITVIVGKLPLSFSNFNYVIGPNTIIDVSTVGFENSNDKPVLPIDFSKIILNNESKSNEIFKGKFDFMNLGIGGLDAQFDTIFRRAFASRSIPKNILSELGIKHIRGMLLYGAPGNGKCIAKNTPILLHNGQIKMVQDVNIDDKLMGDDSQPRNISSLCRGKEMMYKISYSNGESYTVNESHILSLQINKSTITKHRKNKTKNYVWNPLILNYEQQLSNEINNDFDPKIDINLTDYLKLPQKIKNKLYGYRVGVEFENRDIHVDPYFVGLMIGSNNITNLEKNIQKYIGLIDIQSKYKILYDKYNLHMVDTTFNKLSANKISNIFIPDDYKINSHKNRLKLLAGIIDACGVIDNGSIVLNISLEITKDILYLMRSLGIKSYAKSHTTRGYIKLNNSRRRQEPWHLTTHSIYFGINFCKKIPILSTNINNVLNTLTDRVCNLNEPIKITAVGVDDYYGFVIDGNRRFLLGDFTVTHNTLIARQMGKILNCVDPIVVNGPSLLSKYIGESEENVRKLFQPAIDDKNPDNLHLIICDEFDALVKKRGSGSSDNGVGDKVVNQFLSMIDGHNALNNILIIAMTNRKDLIDDAILRPGRLEIQIEITLPDEKGRNQILQIHTSEMKKSGYLKNIDLESIALMAKNFTGAEIESIVKNAVSYSISRELDPKNLSTSKSIKPVITQQDFIKSVNEIIPLFGSKSKEIDIITSRPFELYSNDYKKIYDEILDKISNLNKGNLLSIMLMGDKYVGKTTLACHIAKTSKLTCVKFINSETLINSTNKELLIYEMFDTGCKSESFILIIDSVEKIIEFGKVGNVYNNRILQSIYTICDKVIPNNKSLVILLTSSNRRLMNDLDFCANCDYTYILNDSQNIVTGDMYSGYFLKNKYSSKKLENDDLP